ncbi:HAD family hydrolase [Micromonospora pallida]|uniref:HAD family hydrolase n=1 Tax=Micromonospora pallida TaxID=145854 RepID=UPI000AB5007F|nr:HAD family hydrolase [Micromonospora pallida]
MLWYAAAGLDAELAEQLYDFDAHAPNRPLYPDVLDVLRRLRAARIRLVVLSDIHLDLRPLLAYHGAADLLDGYVLSCEHGLQKPDPRLFLIGLRTLGTTPQRTLMVGDLATNDGGATEVGITTLILPRVLARPDRPRLDHLVRLVVPQEAATG